MPIFNQVYTATITNGGGTINLDVTDSTTTLYEFSGTATLSSSVTIQPTGTPAQGMEFIIRWQAVVTIGVNSVTIFGTALTAAQALQDLQITCYYNGSTWDVDILEDNISELWVAGSGVNSVVQKGSTGGANGDNAVSLTNNCLATGNNSISGGGNSSSTGISSISFGLNSTATANYAVAIGNGAEAIGISSAVLGFSARAEGENSNVVGSGTALADRSQVFGPGRAESEYSTAIGPYARALNYGQKAISGTINDFANGGIEYSQKALYFLAGITSNNTPTLLYLDDLNTQLLTVPENTTMYINGTITAVQKSGSSGTAGDSATWEFKVTIKRVSNTTSQIGDDIWQTDTPSQTTTVTQFAGDASASAWTVTVAPHDATETFRVTATGENNKTIYWHCVLDVNEIKWA